MFLRGILEAQLKPQELRPVPEQQPIHSPLLLDEFMSWKTSRLSTGSLSRVPAECHLEDFYGAAIFCSTVTESRG